MNNEQLTRLKEVLSVPTKTYKEDGMVEYICKVLDTIDGVTYYTDGMNNVYATKGSLSEGDYYPMFIAHTDTVHELVDEIVVEEEMLEKPPTFGRTFTEELNLSLKGYTPHGNPTGIGGDDKCGVFLALELLRVLNTVKVGLFVSEETGCHGSKECDVDFLKDVGYAVQFDAPGNHLVTEVCSGTRLFEDGGDFISRIKPVFERSMGVSPYLQSHPYTDVSQIKQKGDFSCINFSCGYYNMHTANEFVVVKDVEDAFNLALNVVNELGFEKYDYTYVKPNYSNYGQGSLFTNYPDDDYDDYEYDYKESDWVDGDNHYFHIGEDEIEIESKTTGDVISLNLRDMGELYLLIRERLLENEEI
jgi:putative aminopeptidase FrvX